MRWALVLPALVPRGWAMLTGTEPQGQCQVLTGCPQHFTVSSPHPLWQVLSLLSLFYQELTGGVSRATLTHHIAVPAQRDQSSSVVAHPAWPPSDPSLPHPVP